jgi:uncharacterized protein YprB with RNaseH-like and TPR domain
VSLRSKLSRLSLAGAPSQPALAGQTAAPEVAPLDSRGALLDELRARIRTTIERAARRAPPPPPPVDTPDLPFVTTETPLGPLHVRTQRLDVQHRTGRAPIAYARHADARVLSLLALDPSLRECDLSRAVYLDTETTGLSTGTGTIAFLVGLAWWDRADPPSLVLEQILVRNLGEEAPMLALVRERIEGASAIVTFNGKSFDLPLLRARLVMARTDPFREPPHLDLLHVARRVHAVRSASGLLKEGCRLVALEREVLGFERSDDVESRDVAACYLHFLRTGDTRGLLSVVEHNAWDVVAMAALVGVYGAPDHESLAPDDLVGVARTLRRAGALDRAIAVADAAVERSGTVSALAVRADALRARADIAKARGDRDRALADFEALAAAVDDAGVRLQLAKIYEHWLKAPERALAVAAQGTGEEPEGARRRVERLTRKATRSPARRAGRRKGVVEDLQRVLDVPLADDERGRDP